MINLSKMNKSYEDHQENQFINKWPRVISFDNLRKSFPNVDLKSDQPTISSINIIIKYLYIKGGYVIMSLSWSCNTIIMLSSGEIFVFLVLALFLMHHRFLNPQVSFICLFLNFIPLKPPFESSCPHLQMIILLTRYYNYFQAFWSSNFVLVRWSFCFRTNERCHAYWMVTFLKNMNLMTLKIRFQTLLVLAPELSFFCYYIFLCSLYFFVLICWQFSSPFLLPPFSVLERSLFFLAYH